MIGLGVAVRRVTAVAGADVSHGAYCRLEDGEAHPHPEADGSGGIAAGPWSTLEHIPAGEPLELQTDGGIMTAEGWKVFQGGKVAA